MAMSTLRQFRSLVSQFFLTLRSAALALAIITSVLGVFAQSAPAQTFTALASFDGADGANPPAISLVQGLDGNFYGTTEGGGAKSQGAVFKITPGGVLTLVYSFCSQSNCDDGINPYGGLVQAPDGSLYGTTHGGGKYDRGTVFKVTPNGTLTTLHSFGRSSGLYPAGALVQATNGNFYGTAEEGGVYGGGTVFKISSGGVLKVLYSFCSQTKCADGSVPLAGLVQATNGSFYGTTAEGGSNNDGTVFKITPSGTFTSLYSFCSQTGCADGSGPLAGLVQATNGNLYGTTGAGGANSVGTVFRITPSGALTSLYSFCAKTNCTDGKSPTAGVIQATDGNFYGTASAGGISCSLFHNVGCGTVFKMTPSGTLTTLYSFCQQTNCPDGAEPYAGLVQATDGNLYGAPFLGGATNVGTVFSIGVGLGPFVEALPGAAQVGMTIDVLGQSLTGTTAVSFNGTAASFSVISDTYLTATVPSGATTGPLTVITPGGKLKSNKKFLILK
jgi:uncharacterized repeat protein (TIGR03803 family)